MWGSGSQLVFAPFWGPFWKHFWTKKGWKGNETTEPDSKPHHMGHQGHKKGPRPPSFPHRRSGWASQAADIVAQFCSNCAMFFDAFLRCPFWRAFFLIWGKRFSMILASFCAGVRKLARKCDLSKTPIKHTHKINNFSMPAGRFLYCFSAF